MNPFQPSPNDKRKTVINNLQNEGRIDQKNKSSLSRTRIRSAWEYDYLLLAFLSRSLLRVESHSWRQAIPIIRDEGGESFSQLMKALMEQDSSWEKLIELKDRWESLREELIQAEKQGVVYLTGDDILPFFPALSDPPRALCLIGNPQLLSARKKLAVVGSRDALPAVLDWLDEQLTFILQKLPDLLIVSGGARGIDQQAHWTAIRQRKPTLVWLPSGVLNPYPKSWSGSHLQILKDMGGGVVSEYHPYEPMRSYFFRERNRLIVASSHLCFIPQMRLKSGSYLSARYAAELGIPLALASPPAWDPAFSGNIELISQGAYCLFNGQEIVDFYMMQ